MVNQTPAVEESDTIRKIWLRGLGVFWIILGTLAIIAAFAATLATVLVFGILLLLAGLAQLAQAFADRNVDFGWRLAASLLYGLAGILLIVDPVGGAIGLTLLIALLFLFGGLLRLAFAFSIGRQGRSSGLYILGGLLNLVLAILIIAGWPETGAWVIGLFVGIELVFGGLILLLTPSVARRATVIHP